MEKNPGSAFLKDYRSQKFDLVFDLRADDRGAIMARLSGAPIRAALYYRDVSLLRNRMFTHLAKGEISTGISGPAEQSLLAALGKAFVASAPGIFNTDQGSQFTSSAFTDMLKETKINISMDGRGRAMETFFARLCDDNRENTCLQETLLST